MNNISFSYNGDDRCPACMAMYCANCDHWPAPDDKVKCMRCGHEDKLEVFIACYYGLDTTKDDWSDDELSWAWYFWGVAVIVFAGWVLVNLVR